MTKSAALIRARMLLGKRAFVRSGKRMFQGEVRQVFEICETYASMGYEFTTVRGDGLSWENALDEAELYKRGVTLRLLSEDFRAILEALPANAPTKLREKLTKYLGYAEKREELGV